MRWRNSEFQSRGKCEGAGSLKEDRLLSKFPGRAKIRIGFSCRHILVSCVRSCSQTGSPTRDAYWYALRLVVGTSPQNGTSTISTLYSTVKDHTELAFAVVKRNEQIHRPHESYLGCCWLSAEASQWKCINWCKVCLCKFLWHVGPVSLLTSQSP